MDTIIAEQLESVKDPNNPIDSLDIVRLSGTIITKYPTGIDLTSIVPISKEIMALLEKESKMEKAQKMKVCEDILVYIVENTDFGSDLEALDPIIKLTIPTVLELVYNDNNVVCASCTSKCTIS